MTGAGQIGTLTQMGPGRSSPSPNGGPMRTGSNGPRAQWALTPMGPAPTGS